MGSTSSALVENRSEVDGQKCEKSSAAIDISSELARLFLETERPDDQDLELALALSASLTEQTIFDLPPDERPLIEPAECIACLETLPPSSFPAQSITSTCDHSAPNNVNQRICTTCLSRHLDVQLNESGPNRLTCPICLAVMTHSDIQRWASSQTFSRYDSLKAREVVSSDPDFIWCCNPRCGSGQVHASGPLSPIVICQACGTRTCFNHPNCEWHEGLTCFEFDHPEAAEERRRREAAELEAVARQQQEEEDQARRRTQEDEQLAREIDAEQRRETSRVQKLKKGETSKRLRQQQQEAERVRRAEEEAQRRKAREEEQTRRRKQREEDAKQARAKEAERAQRRKEEQMGEAEVLKTSKPCPGRGCSYRIFKIDGCKHMTCTRCRHEWCWICNQPWRTGHLREECG